MTARQTRFYTDVCDIYFPKTLESSMLNNDIADMQYEDTPSFSNVPFRRETGPEFDKGRFYGRITKEDTVSLMDKGHFSSDIPLQSNCLIHVKTPNVPDEDKYFRVQGAPMAKIYFARKVVVYLKRVNKPWR